MHSAVFLLFSLAITTLAIVHGIALAFSLYWVYLWLDIPMHALGGVSVALGYQSRFMLSRAQPLLSFGFFATLCAVLVVGLTWEVYEYIVGPILPGYAIDTAIDIVMDILGGTLGYALARAMRSLS